MSSHKLMCHAVRRSTHPTQKNLEIYTLKVRCNDIDRDIPFKAVNPREPNLKSPLSKDIQASLLKYDDNETPFDLINKGMFVIAESLTKLSPKDGHEEWLMEIDDSEHARQGVLDGMHTYTVIKNSDDIDDDQYVNMTVTVGCPENMIDRISEGLNRAREVQKISLLDNKKAFKWIETLLEPEHYSNLIEYHENDSTNYDSGKKPISIKHILAIMNIFNPHFWDKESHPIVSFNRVGKVIDLYEDEWMKGQTVENNRFIQMKPILSDLLYFSDLVSCGKAGSGGWRDIWNDSDKFQSEVKATKSTGKSYEVKNGIVKHKNKRSAGNLKATTKKNSKYHFMNTEGDYRLDNAWVYPILGAFRSFTEIKEDGTVHWKKGGFNALKDAWENHGNKLLTVTYTHSANYKHSMTAVGKDPLLWDNLYMKLAMSMM